MPAPNRPRTIVRADEVDRVRGAPVAAPLPAAVVAPPVLLCGLVAAVHVRRAAQRRGKLARPGPVRALDELPHCVPELAVPLSPAAAVVGERAHLRRGWWRVVQGRYGTQRCWGGCKALEHVAAGTMIPTDKAAQQVEAVQHHCTALARARAPPAPSHHTHLVQAVAVPRLSDHLCVPQDGVLRDGLDEWGVAQGGAGGHARAVGHHAAVVHDGTTGQRGGLPAVWAHLLGVPGGGGACEDGRQVKPAGAGEGRWSVRALVAWHQWM
jgi:hypothetical protein